MADWRMKKTKLLDVMVLLDGKENKHVERRCFDNGCLGERSGELITLFSTGCKDSAGFAEHMRMPHPKFMPLLSIIGPSVQKRMSILVGEHLALTLRHLEKVSNSCPFNFRRLSCKFAW